MTAALKPSGRHTGATLDDDERAWMIESCDRGMSIADIARWSGKSRAIVLGVLQGANRMPARQMDDRGMKPQQDGAEALADIRRDMDDRDRARRPVWSRYRPGVPSAAVFGPRERYGYDHLRYNVATRTAIPSEDLRRSDHGIVPAVAVPLVTRGWR